MQGAISCSMALPAAIVASVVKAVQLQPPLRLGVDDLDQSMPAPAAHMPVDPVSNAHGREQPASDFDGMQMYPNLEAGGRGLLSPTALPRLGLNREHDCRDIVMEQDASPSAPLELTLAMSTEPTAGMLPSVEDACTDTQAASEHLATPSRRASRRQLVPLRPWTTSSCAVH
jgi:hypothetical protein